jgi:hypothetical protein
MKRILVLLVCSVSALCGVAGASRGPVSFSGSCSFAGPISPAPPITVVPKPGAHFSYVGSGMCRGTLGGASVDAAPITVTFTNVSTLFDTCELGPDFGLRGVALIGSGATRARFAVTVNLARLAVAGPFVLNASGGGSAAGVAQFEPADTAAAVQQCGADGVSKASLSAEFQTLAALVGVADPAPVVAPRRAVRHRHVRHWRAACRHRRRCSHRAR